MLLRLIRTREAMVLLAANVVAAVASAFLPLADHVGFEFAAVLTIVAALFAPWVGFAAMRIAAEAAPPPAGRAVRTAQAAALGGVIAILPILPALLVILLNGVRRPTCAPASGAVWLLLLPVPGAWLAATTGAFVRLVVVRARFATTAMLATLAASVVASMALVYFGPAYFVLDHFFGYFPGPIYDESVLISAALLTFRGATLLWGVAAVFGAAALAAEPGRSRRRWRVAAGALAGSLLAVSLAWGPALGWRTTDRSLAAEFGAELNVDRLVLHYPRTWNDRTVEELMRDAAYDAAEVQRALGITITEPVHVWVYQSAADKRRLVGAAGTSFAKPWRHEVHMNASGFPNLVLRHELVHAILGEVADRGVWHTPGDLMPKYALIEGFAEAYDVDDEDQTLDERARAMRDVHLAPDLEKLFTTQGFLAEASSRAYAYAGAFIRYLADRFGAGKMRELYASGSLESVGEPAILIREFERHLDSVHVDAPARATAARRFAQPGIARRSCGREVSTLLGDAVRLGVSRRWAEAFATYDRAIALQPENPGLVRSKLSLALSSRSVDAGRVRAVADQLWQHPALDPALEASARIDVGDYFWRTGDTASARAMYARAAELPSDPATQRAKVARVRAFANPALRSLLEPLLAELNSGLEQLFRLSDAAGGKADPLVLYLLGRQLALRGAEDRGAELLERADRAGLGDRELSREALRVLARARATRHHCELADAARESLAAHGSRADEARARDWVTRCKYEVARGWPALGG